MLKFITALSDGTLVEVDTEFYGQTVEIIEVVSLIDNSIIELDELPKQDVEYLCNSAMDERLNPEDKEYVKNKKQPKYNN